LGFAVEVNDEVLRNGWWNETAQKEYREKFPNKYPDVELLVRKMRKEIEVKPFDGVVVFRPNDSDERFTVHGAIEGIDLDEDKLRQDILSFLKTGKPEKIIPKTKPIKSRSESEVISKLGLRGGYTTYFECNPNREHNIELALEKFNGLVIQNGQTVSFNKTVGPRSASRGFREAKIILDGEFVPGIGGGVCQASTTLFNAVMLAGLTIDKSHNHSLAISYVPIGRDAMVSSGADLVFTNDTGGAVYIETGLKHASEGRTGSCYVRIYGDKTKVKFKPRVEVAESEDSTQARTYIEAWSGERLVHSKLVRRSSYKESYPL